MEETQDHCNTVLTLALGIGGGDHSIPKPRGDHRKPSVQFNSWFKEEEEEDQGIANNKQDQLVGRSRSKSDEEEYCDDNKGGTRKKLRLSKEQSALLEDSFRAHNTLTLGQKQQLAERLNLRPRQVEVWFQNRRARTKLKQTEVDCEFLKKCCESLSDENRRLKRELLELRAAKPAAGSPLYVQLSKAATMKMCPSCERADGKPGTVEDKPKFLLLGSKDSSMTC